MVEKLHSKESKAFVQKIGEISNKLLDDQLYPVNEIKPATSETKPLDEDELETIRKIYDEAKIMLEQAYRKTFHKLPPNDWHLTITDTNANTNTTNCATSYHKHGYVIRKRITTLF